MTHDMALVDHAEAWAREQGQGVPGRGTPEHAAMYERWIEYAFKDMRPPVKMSRAYGMRMLRWASGGDALQVAGSAWAAGHEVDIWRARDALQELHELDRAEPRPGWLGWTTREREQLGALITQLERKVR